MPPPSDESAVELDPRGGADRSSALVRFGRRSWHLLGILGVLAVAGYVINQVQVVAVGAILGVLIAAAVEPLMRRLAGHGWPRSLAALTVTLGWIAVLLGIFALIGWRVVEQVPEISSQLGDAISRLREQFPALPIPANGQLDEMFPGGGGGGGGVDGGQAVSGLRIVAEILTGLVLAIVFSFFFLRDGARMWRSFVELWHEENAGRVDEMGRVAYHTTAQYVRGLTVVAFADASLSAIGLFTLGVPLASALVALTFFAAYIPTVGAFVVGGLAVASAFASGGTTMALIVLILYTAIQQIDGNVLQPWVMGHRLPLHPAVVLAALAIGGLVAGVIGALLAVPLAGASVAAARVWRRGTIASPR